MQQLRTQCRVKTYPRETQNKIIQQLTQQALRQFPFQLGQHDVMLQEKIYNMIMNKQFQVDWQEIAESLKLTRWQVYHWYHESYARICFSQRITSEDKAIMRQELMRAVITDQPLDRQFQYGLKQKLSNHYNRAEFSMVYNNLLRSKEIRQVQQLKGHTTDNASLAVGASEEAFKQSLLHLWEKSHFQ